MFKYSLSVLIVSDIRRNDAQAKIVIFSQWNGMIEKVAKALSDSDVSHAQARPFSFEWV